MLLFLVAYARSFVLFLVYVCLVPGDGPSEQHIRRVNPGRSTSKRYCTLRQRLPLQVFLLQVFCQLRLSSLPRVLRRNPSRSPSP